ncbi:hypothetical protein GCM10023093_07490 [Nemorincola caseinilytica]|uniref:Ig-like domain-containing protein n=2 Tax=Nemorincola caseinilytica TaxID=2054315 RepID=A0ABP8N8Z0_9BACT
MLTPPTGSAEVTVEWHSTGPKQLKVRRVSTDPEFCPGPETVIDITHETMPVDITGDTGPCPNSYRDYSCGYYRGEVYDWAVYPNTVGSVAAGMHGPVAHILWNNVAPTTTASVVVTVRKCDSVRTDTLAITIAGGLPIAYTSVVSDTICSGDTVHFTATSGGAVYRFEFGDNSHVVTSSNTASHLYPENHTSSIDWFVATVKSSGGCAPTGFDTVNIFILPVPDVHLDSIESFRVCAPYYHEDVSAIVTHNLPITSYTWITTYGNGYALNDSTYRVTNPDTIQLMVTASNGCSGYSERIPFGNLCGGGGEYIEPCNVSATYTVSCSQVTLSATSSGGVWRAYEHPFEPTGGTTAVATVTRAGIYRFSYDEAGTDCGAFKEVKVHVVPNFDWGMRCEPAGNVRVFLRNRTSMLPGYSLSGYQWYAGTPGTLISTAVETFTVVPAGTTFNVRLVVTGSISGGTPFSCDVTYTIEVPVLPDPAFTITSTPMCEKLPISFTPAISGSGTSHYWDFDDGATLLLADAKREFTWASPSNPNIRAVKHIITDAIGCKDSATYTVDVHQNVMSGNLGQDTTICSGTAPYTLVYAPAIGTPIPISYLWSTGETTATKDVYSSGAYWVTVTGVYQCSATMPKDSAANVRVIQTPAAVIRGPRHYCAGQEIVLNGYAGKAQEYQWYIDGTPVSPDPVLHWTSGVDTLAVQLVIRTYDSVTGRYCTDASPIDTIRIYSLPDSPAITGPTVLDCDLYHLQLGAAAPVSGLYNWVGHPAGPVVDIYQGGPYRVWFTDLRGCTSTGRKYVPLDPATYQPYFPDGCYEICRDQTPLTLYGPPCVSFDAWRWGTSTSSVSGGPGEMDPLDISTSENYYWRLNNGLCRKIIGYMDLSISDCKNCPDAELTASLICEPDSPASYSVSVGFTTSAPGMTYVLGTDIGPITPFTGTIAGTGPQSPATLTFTTMESAPLPDSVTIQLILSSADGERCYYAITIPLDTCSWIAERHGGGMVRHTSLPSGKGRGGASSALLVFPNPASGDVAIQYDYGTTMGGYKMLTVFDMLGRKMGQTVPEGQQGKWTLDATGWVPGMYVVRMEGDGRTLHTQRLTITH